MEEQESTESSRMSSRSPTPAVYQKHRRERVSRGRVHVRGWAYDLVNFVVSVFGLLLVFAVVTAIESGNLLRRGKIECDYVTLPRAEEQKAATLINNVFESLPELVFSPTSKVALVPTANVAMIVSLLFAAISNGVPSVAGLLVSLMLLFDETFYCVVANNPATAVQIELALVCFIFVQALGERAPFSFVWMVCVLIAWCCGVLASVIRVELALPVVTVMGFGIIGSVMSVSRRDMGFIGFTAKLILSVALMGICWAIANVVTYIYGVPRAECVPVDVKALLAEAVIHPHNIKGYIVFTVVVFLFFLVFDIPAASTFPYFLAAVASLVFPMTSVIDDLLVRWTVFKVLILIYGGKVLSLSSALALPVAGPIFGLFVYGFHYHQ